MKQVIYGDFNNRDPEGCVRFNTIGTIKYLAKFGIRLEDGLHLIVSDGELIAEVIVRRPGSEGVWRGEIISDPLDNE